ncbi:uncharacterized protein LOC109849019 isoform X2 [Asparagus officinalis]|uniref:uncharacterized protein LOC109849019 isoform X2 n=1 Tax=Asparagus officinalis TaxID=4686 RepID=UPI00098E7783|nr:uncharacterized protein LOC109849019 isoform X2 [Asparagus officinalis]
MIPSARHRSLSSSMQSAARRISLISRSKRGFVERSYAVLGTKRCFVASVPSESFGEEKRRGRVSRQERRRMLEDFVERFRALNAGKFPTVSHAKKQVGGSFYVVREIIQEIEYNHRTSPKKLEKPAGWAKKDVNANTVESLVIKDGLEVGPVQLPLLSTNTENAFIEESSSHSTTEVVHSNEKIIEGNEDSRISKLISSDDHFLIEDQEKDSPSRFVERDASDAVPHQVIDIESPKKDSPLRLANDNGKDNVEDPTKFQADTSVHLKLETEIDALNTSKSIEDKSSPASAQEESDLRSNEEVSKSDYLTGILILCQS